MVNTFEIFITFFLLAFLVGGGFKLVRKVLRYLPDELAELQGGAGQSRKMARTEKALASSVGTEASDFENYDGLFTRPVLKKLLLPFGCSLGIFALAGLLSLWLVPTFGFLGVCYGDPTAWVAADLFLAPAVYLVYKKLKKVKK